MSGPQPTPGMLNITPYKGGEAELDGRKIVAKLSSNESSLGPSQKAIQAYQAVAGDLHRYPDGSSTSLRDALAEYHDLKPENIIVSNGSDELISQLVHAYCGPGDEVVYSAHGFLMYPLAAMAAGATPVAAPETAYTADVEALLAAVNERTKIVFVANPNNPTGTYLTVDEMRRLQSGLPGNVLLVMDCAYAEYVTRNDYSPGIELVEAHENIVMTRTFSKIYGLAALRLGWGYCPTEVAQVCHRIRGPFNVNAAAQAAGLAAIQDVAHIDQARAMNSEWLPWLTSEFERLGMPVIPSVGNFVTVNVARDGADAATVFDYLKGQGIIGRMVGAYGLGEHIRLTVGNEVENRAVIAAMEQFVSG